MSRKNLPLDDDLEYLNDAVWLDHGKPVIAGTRLFIKDLLAYVTHYDNGLERFRKAYPWVARKDLVAALEWVAGEMGSYNGNRRESQRSKRNATNRPR